jgi:heptosyltransferase I
MKSPHILIVRLGAMGDVVHALPAAATLKHHFPSSRLTWAVDPKWAALLDHNPYIDQLLTVNRRDVRSLRSAWHVLTRTRYDIAIDLQGLIKSALVARCSRAPQRIGFHRSQAREPLASRLYTTEVRTASPHFADQCLELARAAGAVRVCREFPLPAGTPEGDLPPGPFVLACPLAGWTSKQWPAENYAVVAQRLRQEGSTLVVNGPPVARAILQQIPHAHVHVSGIEGLIDATRKASAVIGVDSGPLHLAAALAKPGVALYGPTDPARNGPYCATITVLRDPRAETTYRRGSTIANAMRSITPDMVLDALRIRMDFHLARSGA